MSLKLLVVDDEPAILNVIKTIVEPLNCDVVAIQDSDPGPPFQERDTLCRRSERVLEESGFEFTCQ
jgi:CheY-like chemotaxis protein